MIMEENINKFIIRLAELKDSRRIWGIRNHPEVRRNSGNSKVIPFANHLKWFETKYFKEPGNFCFVLEEKNRVIGYCRFDFKKEDDFYEISIALDPEYHGRGLGHRLLSEALILFPSGEKIMAEIKKSNFPSQKLFEKNKFVLNSEDDENYYYMYK